MHVNSKKSTQTGLIRSDTVAIYLSVRREEGVSV